MAKQEDILHQRCMPQGGITDPKPAPKRLVICCDGTWQASDHGTQEVPSNIAKLSRAIAKTFVNEDNAVVPQIVHYDAGVATADWIDAKVSGRVFPYDRHALLPCLFFPYTSVYPHHALQILATDHHGTLRLF